MRFVRSAALTVVVGLSGFIGGTAWAHHSFVSDFDPNKPTSIQGTVSQVQWENPHARFFVAVKNAADPSKYDTWEVELGSPNTLINYSWTRKTLTPGMTVTVTGYLARDGHKYMNSTSVKLPDGRTVSAGSSYHGGTETGKTPGL